MRKIFILLFALMFLLPMMMEAKSMPKQLRPFTDSLHSATTTADTSAWHQVPEGIDSMVIMIMGLGATALDAIDATVDFAEFNPLDSFQLWDAVFTKNVVVGDTWGKGSASYAYPGAFKYVRLRRIISVVTANVTMRAWLVCYIGE